jgi:hypothetical protein
MRAAQLRVAADERPFAGPAPKRLVHLKLDGGTAAADRVFFNRRRPPRRSGFGT